MSRLRANKLKFNPDKIEVLLVVIQVPVEMVISLVLTGAVPCSE